MIFFVSQVGQIHIGDMVNVFRHGSLVMQNLGDSTIPHTGTLGVVHILRNHFWGSQETPPPYVIL